VSSPPLPALNDQENEVKGHRRVIEENENLSWRNDQHSL